MATETAKYKVFLRIKPLNVQNIDDRINTDTLTVTDVSITTRQLNKKNEIVQCHYSFEKVFKPSASQKELFDDIVLPRLSEFFQGQDALVFTYGTSNSGKSFTMQGTPAEPGIIPRVLHSMFQSIDGYQDVDCQLVPFMSCQAAVVNQEKKKKLNDEKLYILENLTDSHTRSQNMTLSGVSSQQIISTIEESCVINPCLDDDVCCSVWISFYEIYNENVFDLLACNETSLQNPLKLGYDKEDDSYYPMNLKEVHANTWDEAYNFYRYGKKNLRVAETLLNRKSSRSHCVFTVKLLLRPQDEPDQYISVKSFILCDLAGSERMKHTDNMGKSIVKEMLSINTSLLTLNKCFIFLSNSFKASKGNEPTVLPYRDSKLTMLFKKFFRGQGQLTMVASISQESDLYYQTEQVLRMTSLAHSTRVERKPCENVAFKLPLNMLRRRFSIMMADEQTTPVSGLRSNYGSNQKPQNCYQELEVLKKKNADLMKELRDKESSNIRLQAELRSVEESEANLKAYNAHLSSRMEAQDSNYHSNVLKMEEKYRIRVGEAHKREMDYLIRLTEQESKMYDLVDSLKDAFRIPEFTGPRATVQQAIYIHNEKVAAAVEEVEELEKLAQGLENENVALRKTLSDKDNELAEMEGRLRESEALRQQLEAQLNDLNYASEADDEKNKLPGRLLNNERVKSHGVAQWISDDESSPLYVPPKAKTTGKKKKKKMAEDVPSYSSILQPEGFVRPAVVARRKLLGRTSDFLGDHLQLDETLEDTQLSPGTIMKKTLRSGKRIF